MSSQHEVQQADITLSFRLKKLREGLWYRLKRAGMPIYRNDARGQVEGFRLQTTRYPEPGGCFVSHFLPATDEETPAETRVRLAKMEEFVWLYRDILHDWTPPPQPMTVRGEPSLFIPLAAPVKEGGRQKSAMGK